jgi:serine/threonine protein kinase
MPPTLKRLHNRKGRVAVAFPTATVAGTFVPVPGNNSPVELILLSHAPRQHTVTTITTITSLFSIASLSIMSSTTTTTTCSRRGSHFSCSSNSTNGSLRNSSRRRHRPREEDEDDLTRSRSSTTTTTTTKTHRISRWALQELADFCNTQIHTPELEALPHIPHEDLEIRHLLGEGGFASVYEVCWHDNNNTTLALKRLRSHKRGRTEEDWILAVFDLCNEATILGRVGPHENIVSLRGVCQSSVSEAYKSHPEGWFFLEEKLQDTLAHRLSEWSRELKTSTKGGLTSRFRNRRHSSPSTLMDPSRPMGVQLLSVNQVYNRLHDVALGIANAMKHFHSDTFQIVVRDLKPQNIGFDSHGVVKLFDLAMARPLQKTATAVVAGTFRYLSPEALLGKPISLESDVYSFGIILYELVTLSKPFHQFYQRGKLVRREAFYEEVVVAGWRPDLSDIPCRATARLIAKCWDPSPRARPSFARIHQMLHHILAHRDTTTTATDIMTQRLSPVTNNGGARIPSDSDRHHPSSKSLQSSADATSIDSDSPLTSSPPPVATFRGLFRGLKPLSSLKKRACSDNTVTTSVGSSGNVTADYEE